MCIRDRKYASQGEQMDVASRIDNSRLIVRVTDQGPGIPWSKRKTVFRPFARLDESIHAPSGTGIGLTIARRLARRHGGELKMISIPKGASFELKIPIQQPASFSRDDNDGKSR